MNKLITTLAILAASTATTASPTTTLDPRSAFQGSIQWFTRWDCQNPCVEIGMCLSDAQLHSGVTPESWNPWIGWTEGCFDRPHGIHSISLSMSNGHGFKGIDKTCAEYEKLVKEKKWDSFRNWDLKTMGHYDADGRGHCSVFKGEEIRAVVYDW